MSSERVSHAWVYPLLVVSKGTYWQASHFAWGSPPLSSAFWTLCSHICLPWGPRGSCPCDKSGGELASQIAKLQESRAGDRAVDVKTS